MENYGVSVDDKQADIIDAFNTTSRYLDDILNISKIYFETWQVKYNLQSSDLKTNFPDTEDSFLDLHLSITNDIVFTKTYDKRDDFDFDLVNFHFLGDDVPHFTPQEFIFLNSSHLLKHLAMLTSILAINV